MEAVKLAEEFKIQTWQAENVIALIDEGNTIPFIARYRKEKTGSLDDQILREFADRLDFLRKLEEMRNKVMEAIEKQGNLTDEITEALKNAVTLTENQIQSDNEIPMNGSLDKLTVQIALIILAYALTHIVMYGLGQLLPNMKSVIYGFNFLIGVLSASLINAILGFLYKKNIIRKVQRVFFEEV